MIFCDLFRHFFSRTMQWRFIKYLFCTYIYVARTVSCILIMDIINHSAGLITSFHMIDAVIRGIHPAMGCCLVVNFSGETVTTQLYPKMMRNFR